MTYRGDPIAEKLDKLAELTGMPRLGRKLADDYPARFRILPSVLLALAVAGLAAQIAWGGAPGFWIVWAAWMGTFVFQPFGTPWQPGKRKLDEREAAVIRHGHFVGMMWTLGVTVLSSLAFALGKMGAMIRLWDIWTPISGLDWMAVTFFLLALEANVAVLAASAVTPEPLEDGEE